MNFSSSKSIVWHESFDLKNPSEGGATSCCDGYCYGANHDVKSQTFSGSITLQTVIKLNENDQVHVRFNGINSFKNAESTYYEGRLLSKLDELSDC